jgi:hypothetical protein
MNKGKKITLLSGARLRRISDDGKKLIDQKLHEGALVEKDTPAKLLEVIESTDKKINAYVVEVSVDNKKLIGWTYQFEIVPSQG